MIDVVSAPGLFARYLERTWEEHDGVMMLAEHSYDLLRGRNHAAWTFLHPNGTRSELRHSLRLYAPHELARMLERAGLEVVSSWGDWEGGELTRESSRLILQARRLE